MVDQRLLVYSEVIDGCSQLFAIWTNIYMYVILYYAVLCYSIHFWKWIMALRKSKCCPDVIQLPLSSIFPKIFSCLDSPTCLSHELYLHSCFFCSKTRVVQLSLKGNLVIWRPFCRRQFGWFREQESQRQQRCTSKLVDKLGLKLNFLFFCVLIALLHTSIRSHTQTGRDLAGMGWTFWLQTLEYVRQRKLMLFTCQG